MKTNLRWLIPVAAGLVVPLALPAEVAADAIVEVAEWMANIHIAELAVAANAFTIIP
jgi:hypothetical protein